MAFAAGPGRAGGGVEMDVPHCATWELLAAGGLRLEVAPALGDRVHRWLPLSARPAGDADPHAVRIRVERSRPATGPVPVAPPTLRLGSVSAWTDVRAGRVRFHSAESGCHGSLALSEGTAELFAPALPSDAEAEGWALYSMLTVSAALLLGRSGRALAHAGAVVAPGGAGVLLVGDSHAGKSTTCVSLVTRGWDYLSDDQVVLRDDGGAVHVEGWLRTFHMDPGWQSGQPVGSRVDLAPAGLGPGKWRASAVLGALLFPRVEADLPTCLLPLSPVDALGRLIRQSPWLLADPGAAPGVLALLQRTVKRPAYALRLGLDSFRDAGRLEAVLAPALARRPVSRGSPC